MAWTERYVDASADGSGNGTTTATSGANGAWTLAQAVASASSGHRVNVKAGTYANTTTSRSFNVSGTATSPVWWRGYNTTPGDCDSDPTLTKPQLTFTTGRLTIGGSEQTVSSIDVTGATSSFSLLSVTGTNISVHRCRFEDTAAATAASAADIGTGADTLFDRCYFKATGTANDVVTASSVAAKFHGCVFTGGGRGLSAAARIELVGCVFRATGSHGFRANSTGAAHNIVGNTFRGCGGDGVRIEVVPTTGIVLVANNLFAACGGYGLNNAVGSNVNLIRTVGNAFWNNTSGQTNGLGDSPQFASLTESADPHASATNLSLVTAALSRKAAQPGLFENEAYTSYGDVGAVQANPPAPGGLLHAGGFTGGFQRG